MSPSALALFLLAGLAFARPQGSSSPYNDASGPNVGSQGSNGNASPGPNVLSQGFNGNPSLNGFGRPSVLPTDESLGQVAAQSSFKEPGTGNARVVSQPWPYPGVISRAQGGRVDINLFPGRLAGLPHETLSGNAVRRGFGSSVGDSQQERTDVDSSNIGTFEGDNEPVTEARFTGDGPNFVASGGETGVRDVYGEPTEAEFQGSQSHFNGEGLGTAPEESVFDVPIDGASAAGTAKSSNGIKAVKTNLPGATLEEAQARVPGAGFEQGRSFSSRGTGAYPLWK